MNFKTMIQANIFSTLQMILAIILISLVLLQTKGTGLGSTFGGELGFYQTRRGVERLLFILTIIIAGLFLISSLLGLIL